MKEEEKSKKDEGLYTQSQGRCQRGVNHSHPPRLLLNTLKEQRILETPVAYKSSLRNS
jgi:hypothetical protein